MHPLIFSCLIMANCFLECSLMCAGTRNIAADIAKDPLLDYHNTNERKRITCRLSIYKLYIIFYKFCRFLCKTWQSTQVRKCRKITLILLIPSLFLMMLVTFVVLPLVFKYSYDVQRNLLFEPNVAASALFKHMDLGWRRAACEKPENFYINVNKTHSIYLGVWHIRPYFTHDCAEALDIPYTPLNESKLPIALFFHNSKYDRRYFLDTYFELAQFFHVVTFDYRSYGDSSWGELFESTLVNDSVQLYKWLHNQTTAEIFVWGEGLGAAIATHTVAKLSNENIVPEGVVLENAFTSLSEQIKEWYWPLGKILSWMPWYESTITDGLLHNDLSFETSKYILNVSCPIMVLHWPNSAVPYKLGKKLALIASQQETINQRSVTFNLVPWYETKQDMRYSDVIPLYINDFLEECKMMKNKNSPMF